MKQLLKDLLTAYKFGVKTCTTKTPVTVPRMRRTIWRRLFRMMAAKAAPVIDRKAPAGALSCLGQQRLARFTGLSHGLHYFLTEQNDQLKEPMFFGQSVNVARFDQQKYDIFEKLIEKQLSFFWRPEEVDVSRDRIDYQALPEHEKHIFISNLKYQTLLDSIQGRSERGAAAADLDSRAGNRVETGRSPRPSTHARTPTSSVISSTIRHWCLMIS